MVKITARGVNDENNHIAQQSQRLQSQLTISVAAIFSGDCEPCKSRFAPNKVKTVMPEIAQPLRFIKADHSLIVDTLFERNK